MAIRKRQPLQSDQELLLARLSQVPPAQPRPFVFLVGAALATQYRVAGDPRLEPNADGEPETRDPDPVVAKLKAKRTGHNGRRPWGVASVDEVVQIIGSQLDAQDKCLPPLPAGSAYQAAFEHLLKLGGPHMARFAIRRAVWLARASTTDIPGRNEFDVAETRDKEERFQFADADKHGWNLTDGARAIGALIAEFPERFGRYLITTNYDPTLAASIRLARGKVVQTVIHGDGNPGQTIVDGCHLVHLHGYWYGYDTLHTRAELQYPRPQLEAFLCEVLRTCTVVVLGYGGWGDLFARAASRIANTEPNSRLDIVWAFHNDEQVHDSKAKEVRDRFQAAEQGGGRISYYYGIDCHDLLPRLLRNLRASDDRRGESLGPLLDPWQQQPAQLEKIAALGCWLHFQVHGARRVLLLNQDERKSACYGDIFPWRKEKGTPDMPDWWQNLHSWSIQNGEICVRAETYELLTQGAFNGPIPACFDLARNLQNSDEVKDWKQRHATYAKTLGESSVAWKPAILDSSEPRHVKVDGVMAHVLPWPEKLDEFSVAGVTQGQWLKISEDGGTFVIQLESDGTLAESHIFDVTKRWNGYWWIEGDAPKRKLMIFIGSWCLEVYETLERKGDETGAHMIDGFEEAVGAPAFGPQCDQRTLKDLRIFHGLERHAPVERHRGTRFLVAHVIPYTALSAQTTEKPDQPAGY